jgi:hypothetical protein
VASNLDRLEEVHLQQHFQVEQSVQSRMVLLNLFLPNAPFIRPAEGSLSSESICNDGMDNDDNGLVDKEDPNCTTSELLEQGQTILSSNTSEITHVNVHLDVNATFIEDQSGLLHNNETTKHSPHHDIRTSLFFSQQTFP